MERLFLQFQHTCTYILIKRKFFYEFKQVTKVSCAVLTFIYKDYGRADG